MPTWPARGVYLLSFLPESDVERIIGYAAGQGKRSFAALMPDNAYGSVVEAAFKQAVARRGGRVVALERYAADRARRRRDRGAGARRAADAIFIPDGGDRWSRWQIADRRRRQSQARPAAGHRPVGRSAHLLQSRP